MHPERPTLGGSGSGRSGFAGRFVGPLRSSLNSKLQDGNGSGVKGFANGWDFLFKLVTDELRERSPFAR
eukprot:12116246-Karenia_brevis.AAC.1